MNTEETVEMKFRSALADALKMVESLGPICQNLDEVASIMRLAIENDGQLRLLMQSLSKKTGGKL